MEGFLKITTIMAMLSVGATTNASEPVGQGTFSSSSDSKIMITYQGTPSTDSMTSIYATGYGTTSCKTVKFILAGQVTGNMGQSESVCLEGDMDKLTKSWTVNGQSGTKSVMGTGTYKLDSSVPKSVTGSFEVQREDVTITEGGSMMPAVCGQFMLSNPTDTNNTDYSYSWYGTTPWGADASVTWTASGSKSGEYEMHSISGSVTSMSPNGHSASPTGCLTSLKFDSDVFTGSGHINGRSLQVSGRTHSGMYMVDTISFLTYSDMPGFTGSFSYYPGSSGSFYSSSSMSGISGTVYENGTWTTMQPGMESAENGFTGTYAGGAFQGTGKINYMDATVSGQYGASCWFTDSVMVTCPMLAPNATGTNSMYMFSNGSFYLCGMASGSTVNTTQMTASGWMFTAKDQSNPMQLTAEPITMTGDMQIADAMSSPSTKMDATILDTTGKTIASFKGDSYIYFYMGQVSGSISNDKISISIMNGIVMGSNFAVTGMLMNM